MDAEKLERNLGIGLFVYFSLVGATAVVFLVLAFPGANANGLLTFPLDIGPPDRQLLLLALAAGVVGSFIHGAQSLGSYIGNIQFKASWTIWYLLRPCIGGILGLAIYFAFRAGLVGGASVVNPYGVVAVGLLGGWFSKTTSDKLQEVFETLFKTDEDRLRKDKLKPIDRPVVDEIRPSPVPSGQEELVVTGRNFMDGARFLLNGTELPARFESDTKLEVTVEAAQRPAPGTAVAARIKNPNGGEPISESRSIRFE